MLRQFKKGRKLVAEIFFKMRWFLAAMYLALFTALAAYFIQLGRESFHLIHEIVTKGMTNESLMFVALELVDMIMIANLEWFIIMSSYLIFVDRDGLSHVPNKPSWVEGLTTTNQKIKIGTSLIGVSSVALLNLFMKVCENRATWDMVGMAVVIHVTITVTSLAFILFEVAHAQSLHKQDSN